MAGQSCGDHSVQAGRSYAGLKWLILVAADFMVARDHCTAPPLSDSAHAMELSINRAQPQNCATGRLAFAGDPSSMSFAQMLAIAHCAKSWGARAKLQEQEVEHATQLFDRASCPGGAQMVLGTGRRADLLSAGTWLSQRTGLLRCTHRASQVHSMCGRSETCRSRAASLTARLVNCRQRHCRSMPAGYFRR